MSILEKLTIILNKGRKEWALAKIRKKFYLLSYLLNKMSRILAQTGISITDFKTACKNVAKLGV
jgi:hypothetical protein